MKLPRLQLHLSTCIVIAAGGDWNILNTVFLAVLAAIGLIVATVIPILAATYLLERIFRWTDSGAKLPRLQIHLSTCIVLMFAAGGLMWANAVPIAIDFTSIDPNGLDNPAFTHEYGWPTTCCMGFPEHFWPIHYWHYGYLAINIAVALALLAAVAFVCEWIIRRRAPKGLHKSAQGCAAGATLGSPHTDESKP